MNLIQFQKTLTTPELEQVNQELAQLLESPLLSEPSQFTRLSELTRRRELLISDLLSILSEPLKSQFAEKENKLNEKLSDMACSLLESSKEDLVKFNRNQKAVKQYK